MTNLAAAIILQLAFLAFIAVLCVLLAIFESL